MSDDHSFAAFAASGILTGDLKFPVRQAVTGLTDGLTLYVITKTLVGNKYQPTYHQQHRSSRAPQSVHAQQAMGVPH